MKRYITLFLGFGLLLSSASSLIAGGIHWLSFEEAVELSKREPKKIFIDIYTDWCSWCRKMDSETFRNSQVADYINENFYPVKLNSETRDTIYFQGYRFVNDGSETRSAHQLSIALLQGQMSYPSIVYLNEDMEVLTTVPGFMDPKTIEPVLKYIGGDHYKNQSFQDFQDNFESVFR